MAFLEAQWPTGTSSGESDSLMGWLSCQLLKFQKQKLCPNETCLMVKFWPL